MNELAKIALAHGDDARKAQGDLRAKLGLDELNFAYFFALYRMKKSGRALDRLAIFEEGRTRPGAATAFPTAIASPEMLKSLPLVQHRQIAVEQDRVGASGAVLWIKKMQAGTGSAMVRRTYLAKYQDVPADQVHIGAKGTDLFVQVPSGEEVTLAELQIAQLILAARRGEFGGVLFHDIVGTETAASIEKVWKRKSLLDPSKTYAELVDSTPGLGRFKASFQAHIPTLNRQGELTTNRTAPGGHALFAVDALRAAYTDGGLPDTGGKPLVAAVGNGEDLGSTPSRHMVDWMVRHQIPIAMVTTEKTGVDLQGGQIALVELPSGKRYVTLIETAQAKEAGQLDLFQKIGLDIKRPGQMACFNTNVALFNYDVLAPKIRKLVAEIGEEAFMAVVMPDLIDKWKSQQDKDGVTREYLQLEGAMGSTLLNLDRYWRERFDEPLVHFINVDKLERTDYFSPIKNGFDFFMQFHSDRFRLDPETLRLINLRPGSIPLVRFTPPHGQEKYWDDLSTVLDAFRGAKVLDLDTLTVKGAIKVPGVTLEGDVSFLNATSEVVDVTPRIPDKKLRNANVLVGPHARISVT